jgi:hypothetical protein
MKLGLVYVDDQAAPTRPLNAAVLQVCRPDYVSLEVGSVPELRSRLAEARRRRVRANWILPVEKISGMAARLMARTINDEGVGITERVTLGARPFDRGLRPEELLAKVAMAAGELVSLDDVVLGAGVGTGRGPARDWLLDVLALVGGTELRPLVRGVGVSDYPTGRLRGRDARRLVGDIRHFLPSAAIHVETGWRLGLELSRVDAWLEFVRLLVAPGRTARLRVEVDAALRDVWLADAWYEWLELGAASVAVFGYVENGLGRGWSILDERLEASSAWRSLRLSSALSSE